MYSSKRGATAELLDKAGYYWRHNDFHPEGSTLMERYACEDYREELK